jgi:uncharacterized caspase-like protein
MRAMATILFVVLLSSLQPANAEKRVALVMGNSAYQNVNRLANPGNDSDAMATTLRNAGFDVVDLKRDLNANAMRRALRDFSDNARDADVAIVYYAGHGIEIDGINYLIPVDAVLERDIDAFDEAIPLDRLMAVIEPARQLRLVILDACRDNPFSKTMKRTIGMRAIGRGLARVEPASPNTLIAFAAKAGSTASDGEGKYSPFTASLVKYLTRPGLDLRRAFGFARDEVLKATNNRQEPFVYGSLGGDDVPLVPAPPAAPADPEAAIRRAYELALQVGTAEIWDSFIANYPKSFYTDLARAQRRKLAAAEQAAEQTRVAAEKKRALDEAKAAEAERARAAAQARAEEEARMAAEKAAARAKAAEDAKAEQEARLAAEKKAREDAKAAEAERAKAAAQAKADEEARIAAAKAKAAEEKKAAEAELAKAAVQAKADEEAKIAAAKAKAAEEKKAAEAERAKAAVQAKADEEARIAAARAKAADEKKAGDDKTPAKLAALTPAEQAGEATADKPVAPDVPRLLQTELRRVGCITGNIEGSWTAAAQKSLGLFNKHAGTTLDVKVASLDALDIVRSKPARVCPLICDHGYKADGEHCVKISCDSGFVVNDDNECAKKRETPAREERAKRSLPKRERIESGAPREPGSGAYDPYDRGRTVTTGGHMTCGGRGCQMVPKGCQAIRDMGGGGLGGRIVCP